jgi:uncharacterized protein YjbJ (UPF0337 family)
MSFRRNAMNWDTVKGDWKQFKGKVREQWGKLTDDDLNRIEGRRDQLAGAIEKRYGIEKDEAERQVTAFEQECGHCHDENRTESRGKESHEKGFAEQNPMSKPAKETAESAQTRHDPRRQEEHPTQSKDPKFQKEGTGTGRMKDTGMEKKTEAKQPTGAQHSQKSHGKK